MCVRLLMPNLNNERAAIFGGSFPQNVPISVQFPSRSVRKDATDCKALGSNIINIVSHVPCVCVFRFCCTWDLI